MHVCEHDFWPFKLEKIAYHQPIDSLKWLEKIRSRCNIHKMTLNFASLKKLLWKYYCDTNYKKNWNCHSSNTQKPIKREKNIFFFCNFKSFDFKAVIRFSSTFGFNLCQNLTFPKYNLEKWNNKNTKCRTL